MSELETEGPTVQGGDPRPAPDQLPPYQKTLRTLSDRLVEAQRPIRILDACKWDDEVEKRFFASGATELPEVTRESYKGRALGFDPGAKKREFYELERDVRRELGTLNPMGGLLLKASKEYRVVLDMLELRGTPDFSAISQGLYGSTFDRFHAGDPTIGDLGRRMSEIVSRLQDDPLLGDDEKTLDPPTAARTLAARFDAYFGPDVVRVKVDGEVLADAAAGADYVKLRHDARFSERDIDVLEVHEGWIHIGTTLNGLAQPVATFLGKGTPSCTITQEGLAIIQEIFTFRSAPTRIRRLSERVEAIRMAEEGADFLEVYRALLERGNDPQSAFQTSQRAFRGSLPKGCGPFTKDVTYSRGFILIYNFIRLAVRQGQWNRIPLLFVGKVRLADLPTLWQLLQEGLIVPPRFLPPPYTQPRGLAAWMCYSNFLNSIDLTRAADDYAALFAGKAGDL